MKALYFVFFLLLSSVACRTPPVQKSIKPDRLLSGDCSTAPASVKHAFTGSAPWSRTLSLPAKGRFVEESHYVTTQDAFKNKAWPSKKDERIAPHLQRSFQVYKNFDPDIDIKKLYGQAWQKEWTPEEGGHFGQGSVGASQLDELSVEMEMWFLTMMWSKGERPDKGTRFLLSAKGRSVVVQAGYETGPGSQKFIGGVTREVHTWLKTSSDSEITISVLKNKEMTLGPVNCR